MLLQVCFLLFGVCAVSGNPVKGHPADHGSIQDSTDLETRDEFSMMQPRRISRKCTYNNKKYKPGAKIDIPVPPDFARCDRCTCIKRKFQKCTKRFDCEVGSLQCKVEDYEWLPGNCCPVCKRKSCTDDREVNEKWQRIKSLTGQNKGVCSLCECRADGKEFCTDHQFECFDIPGCLETEMKKDFCCPQCKTWATSTTTTQPWFTIKVTEATKPPPFPFPFPFRRH